MNSCKPSRGPPGVAWKSVGDISCIGPIAASLGELAFSRYKALRALGSVSSAVRGLETTACRTIGVCIVRSPTRSCRRGTPRRWIPEEGQGRDNTSGFISLFIVSYTAISWTVQVRVPQVAFDAVRALQYCTHHCLSKQLVFPSGNITPALSYLVGDAGEVGRAHKLFGCELEAELGAVRDLEPHSREVDIGAIGGHRQLVRTLRVNGGHLQEGRGARRWKQVRSIRTVLRDGDILANIDGTRILTKHVKSRPVPDLYNNADARFLNLMKLRWHAKVPSASEDKSDRGSAPSDKYWTGVVWRAIFWQRECERRVVYLVSLLVSVD